MARELNSMKSENAKLEDTLKDKTKELDITSKRFIEEKNRSSELRTQLNWNQKKTMEDHAALQSMLNECKDKLHKTQAENAQMETDKESLEKTIFELQTRLQNKDLSSAAEMRELESENLESKQRIERLLSEKSERSRRFYQYLSHIQQEIQQWANIADGLREQYTSLATDVHNTYIATQNLQNFENVQAETVYTEFKSMIEQANSFISSCNKAEDRAQDLEVALEEEKSRSIMLEERASRFEQQAKEVQRRAENSEKRTEERFGIELERVRNELAQAKSENIKAAEELKISQQRIHVLQISKKEGEEREVTLQSQVRSLTESIKRLQKQLAQTKNLLKMVQDERSSINDESESLRRELHSVLQGNNAKPMLLAATSPGGSGSNSSSSNNLLSSFRESRPLSATRTSLFGGRPNISISSTPPPSLNTFSIGGMNTRHISNAPERRSSLDTGTSSNQGSPVWNSFRGEALLVPVAASGDLKSHLFSKFESM